MDRWAERTNRLHSAHESAPAGHSGDDWLTWQETHTPGPLGLLVQGLELWISIFPRAYWGHGRRSWIVADKQRVWKEERSIGKESIEVCSDSDWG